MQLKQQAFTEIVAVIFAGGEGKRLWPLSTAEKPKQLNPLFSKKTMLLEAYERAVGIFAKQNVVVVTTELLVDDVKKMLSIEDRNLIIQPKNVDTAAAISIAALHLEATFPESIAVFLYSDHYITEPEKFATDIKQAVALAEGRDNPIAIGTRPTLANTQFGYIELGDKLSDADLYKVKSFTEKPQQDTAEEYIKSQRYVWNTGVKVWKTSVLLDVIEKFEPKMYEAMVELRGEIGTEQYVSRLNDWYDSMVPQSFEESISERLTNMVVYVAEYEWKDMGNWQVFYELADKDRNGNAVVSRQSGQKVDLIDAENCLVIPDQKHVAVIGLRDVMVIQSEDTLLVCATDASSRVKEVGL